MPDLIQRAVTPKRTRPGGDVGRVVGFVLPAMTAMYALFQGIQQILIPAQVAAIDPTHKVGIVAGLTTAAAIGSLIGLPTGGSVSDRTRSRFGRRTPWLVATSVVAGVLMITMNFSSNLILLGTVYTVLWFVANFYQGALTAILPDRIPEQRRGVASSVIGLGTPLGILVGVNVASHVSQLDGYTLIGLLFVAATLAMGIGAREGSSATMPPVARRQHGGPLGAVSGFFEAFRSRDFTLAFVSRFAIFLAYFTVSGYLYYTLTDFIGAGRLPHVSVAQNVSFLSSINTVAWIVTALLCGWIADRLDRRKLFVALSAVCLGLTMAIPVIWPTWGGMIAYSALGGASIGIYFAVDLALMSLVLPTQDQEGRDFGILSVATGLPQILSSAIAGALITFAGGYTALYVFGAVCAVIGGAVCFGIRRVR
jgi:MFS family permease